MACPRRPHFQGPRLRGPSYGRHHQRLLHCRARLERTVLVDEYVLYGRRSSEHQQL